MWARAMHTYDRVAKNIGPKKEALAQAEGELEVVRKELGKKQEALRKVCRRPRSFVVPRVETTRFEFCAGNFKALSSLMPAVG